MLGYAGWSQRLPMYIGSPATTSRHNHVAAGSSIVSSDVSGSSGTLGYRHGGIVGPGDPPTPRGPTDRSCWRQGLPSHTQDKGRWRVCSIIYNLWWNLCPDQRSRGDWSTVLGPSKSQVDDRFNSTDYSSVCSLTFYTEPQRECYQILYSCWFSIFYAVIFSQKPTLRN